MKILLCPDKFKGSLSAMEACRAIETGLFNRNQSMEITSLPLADGGEGSLDALASHLDLKAQHLLTTDPLERPISARYFTSADAAFIELASASGLGLLKKTERNPLLTSTLGTGKLLLDALSKGYQDIYLFLGGSATNDAGMGIAAALGFQFLDENKQPLHPMGGNLLKVHTIKNSHLFDFHAIKMTLLCDVTNPLFGPNGAARVYAPQKGANVAQVEFLDRGLHHFCHIIEQHTGMDVGKLPGSGAAGGIATSLVALFGANLAGGLDTISELTGLESEIQSADWVISGEGKLDEQSLQGKVVSGVASLCEKHGKPLLLLVGKNELKATALQKLGVRKVLSIAEIARNDEDAMSNGTAYLTKMAEKLG